jgi:pimeloyl-ACP methyl ester carboxylesterase
MNAPVPLLALPGLLNDERVWQRQVEGLASRHAVTSFALTAHSTIAELAALALARAPAERFALAGFSMGGYVALEIMRQAPGRVLALALVDTSARPDTPQATAARRATITQSATDFDGVVSALVPAILHPSRVGDRALLDVIWAMARSVGREAFVRQQEAIIGRADSRPTLPRIACPTLVVCGRDDARTPLEVHEELAAGIAGARLVVLDDCGHMAPLERPEQLTNELGRWLEEAA